MNKELNEITVNGISYTFSFVEETNTWRVIENDSLIDNYAVDLEIEVEHIGGVINWNEITGFIDYITENRQLINEQLENAQFVLKTFFKAEHKAYYSDDFLKDVIFEPNGIMYKGLYKTDDQKNAFRYSFLYFPYYGDGSEDLGSSSWEANFSGDLFLGVQHNLQ